ncbi:LPXTG cell wall anchor domain-containing protein, partial [Streptococcus australis]
NPSASKVEVGNDGTATVTYPDGTTAVIPADKTVKKSDDKSVKDPAVTPVVDPSNLTDAEKAKVADEVKKANPTASKVEVGNDGTATITYPDGTTAILTPKQTITKVSETGNKGNSNSNSDNNSDKTSNTFVKVPAEKTLVKDPSNLTDAERSEIVSKIKQVNPGATVKVDRYGNATVELNGKTVVISSEQLIVSAKETNGQASHQGRVATDSSKKSESGKLPSTGEEQSVASIGLAILSALTGGLLLSKKRKEEE